VRPRILLMITSLLTAFSVTLTSVLLARGAVAAVGALLAGPRATRRAEARADEAGWIAAAAQRWALTPAALGGPSETAGAFRALTFADLGLPADPAHPDVRRTAVGTYRLLAAPSDALDSYATHLGTDVAAGGLLVVGTDDAPEDAVAVLVLSPLVQVRLSAVPWAWVRALTTPAADTLVAAAPSKPAPGPVRAVVRTPALVRPQHERRMPSWRSPKPPTRRRDGAPERLAA
jgi:hypothetical protein